MTAITNVYASAKSWWTSDTALHSYIFCQFLINLPFAVFNTYVIYQLQTVGFLIGTDIDGQPCTTYCLVDWAGTRLDLNSILLYLNAFAFGLGGAMTLFLCAYSDFWSRKHLLVTFSIICYGAFSIPVYWLQGISSYNFQVLTGLYIVFGIVTLILIAVLNIYIPHCMRNNAAAAAAAASVPSPVETTPLEPSSPPAESSSRTYGFLMSIYGALANASGGIVMFVIVIILSETLKDPTAAQSSGLLVATVVGFITVVGAVVPFYGLPPIPSKSASELKKGWTEPLVEFFRPFRDFAQRKSMAALLISFTVYTDSTFAVGSVTAQLFVAEIRPGTLEYSLYMLAQNLMSLGATAVFLWIRPKLGIRLETWLLVGYALVVVIPVWGCIGLAQDVGFGFKNRWEFYVQLVFFSTSGALVNSSFRVLFSELVPLGNEVRWFGLQLVFSCATVWVNYVASAPLQNATHQLRFPLVLSLVFLLLALGLELCRYTLPVFKQDYQKWIAFDQSTTERATRGENESDTVVENVEVTVK